MELKRKTKTTIVDTLTNAQKFIFAPIAFCALKTAFDLGIIQFIDKNKADKNEIINTLNLDEYTFDTLMDVLEINEIVRCENGIYSITKLGEAFLYDDMTKANFNFVKDVCYLGMNELTESFKEKRPKGLYKIIDGHKTIYSALTSLPKQMQKSWYEFDHLYSDNCFDEIYSIISKKYNSIYDIGGNTGKFEKVCLKNNKNINITMLDLKENIEKIINDKELSGCKFHSINVLNETPNYPEIKNSAILMSQFLDCFSKQDVVKILSDLKKTMDKNSAIYILEPYTDMQNFKASKYSLVHSSLYFTSMANGVSKFYKLTEMKDLINKAGLNISQQFDNIGPFDYTLLELNNAVVSD